MRRKCFQLNAARRDAQRHRPECVDVDLGLAKSLVVAARPLTRPVFFSLERYLARFLRALPWAGDPGTQVQSGVQQDTLDMGLSYRKAAKGHRPPQPIRCLREINNST